MPETTVRNVQVVVSAKKAGDPSAPFKDIEKSAKSASKSVKDIQPVAQTTTDKLRKMFLQVKDEIAGADVKVNRLARSIKELGLTTKDVAAMAKQMGQEWKLSAEQIDTALRRAGQMPLGAKAGGFLGRFGKGVAGFNEVAGGALGAAGMGFMGAAAGKAGLAALPLAGVLGIAHAEREMVQGQMPQWMRAAGDFLQLPGGANPKNWLGQDKTRRLEEVRSNLLNKEIRTAGGLAFSAPFRAQERGFGMQATAMRDEAVGMGMLSPLGRRYTSGMAGDFRSALGGGMGVFGRAGTEFLRAQGEQIGDVTRAGGRAAAEADIALRQAQMERGRAAGEEQGIRQQLGALAPSEIAKSVDLYGQLAQATERRRQAEQAVLQAQQQQNAVSVQNLQTLHQMAKAQADFARQQAQASREELKGGLESFGHMDPFQRREMLNIAQRLKGGQELTPEQMAMGRGAGLGIGELVKDRAMDLARKDPVVAEILRTTGAERKVQEQERIAQIKAEVAVQVQQKIDAKIELNEQAVAKQLTDQLTPLIHKAMADLKNQLNAEMRAANLQRQGQTNAAPP